MGWSGIVKTVFYVEVNKLNFHCGSYLLNAICCKSKMRSSKSFHSRPGKILWGECQRFLFFAVSRDFRVDNSKINKKIICNVNNKCKYLVKHNTYESSEFVLV